MPSVAAPVAPSPALGRLHLSVRLPDGRRLSPAVRDGSRLVDALLAFGVPLRSKCAGRCTCRTCEIRIAPAWVDRVASRLGSCADLSGDPATRPIGALVMTSDLDGLEIEIPSDTLVPQTYWIAG